MTDRELLQQALDCLLAWEEESSGYGWSIIDQETVDAIKARLAQPDDDAVAWVDEITLRDLKNGKEGVHLVYEVEMVGSTPLFEYQPEKEWVGLTDSEREEAVWESGKDGLTSNRYDVALAVEAKLKEKNT